MLEIEIICILKLVTNEIDVVMKFNENRKQVNWLERREFNNNTHNSGSLIDSNEDLIDFIDMSERAKDTNILKREEWTWESDRDWMALSIDFMISKVSLLRSNSLY